MTQTLQDCPTHSLRHPPGIEPGEQTARATDGKPNIPWRRDMITLVNRLHKERKARKITQDQAGDLIGVSGRKYRDFENGYSSLPVDQVFRLAAALGVRVFNADNLADEQGTANQ